MVEDVVANSMGGGPLNFVTNGLGSSFLLLCFCASGDGNFSAVSVSEEVLLTMWNVSIVFSCRDSSVVDVKKYANRNA